MTKTVRFIDLFAGIGGIRIGFDEALKSLGLHGKCVFSSEIKPSAIKVYHQNFPNSNLHGNICKIKSIDIPDFDFLLGGFPCQSFSTAGKRLGFNDARGTMFFQIARILRDKKPKGFLLENVANLLHHDHGKTFHVIYTILKQLGYSVGYRILSGNDFGLAQKRKRIYIIGFRTNTFHHINMSCIKYSGASHTFGDVINTDDPPINDSFTRLLLNYYPLSYLIGKKINDKRGGSNNIHSWDFSLKGKINNSERRLLDLLLRERRKPKWAHMYGIKWMDGMPLTKNMIYSFYPSSKLSSILKDLVHKGYLRYEHPKNLVNHRRVYDYSLPRGFNIVTGKLSFEYTRILNPNGLVPTLVATDMSRLAVPADHGLRSIDIREGLRLFGFPDWFKIQDISRHHAYDLLGNTVCIPVIKAVASHLLSLSYHINH